MIIDFCFCVCQGNYKYLTHYPKLIIYFIRSKDFVGNWKCSEIVWLSFVDVSFCRQRTNKSMIIKKDGM